MKGRRADDNVDVPPLVKFESRISLPCVNQQGLVSNIFTHSLCYRAIDPIKDARQLKTINGVTSLMLA